jgi:AhpD family alkylhydroperoxidase
MRSSIEHLGYLPSAVSLLATSPQLLDGFLKASALFERTTLDPLARETLVMTLATRNGCHVCIAMHTARLQALEATTETINALRSGGELDDPRLEAIRRFTLQVIEDAGAVSAETLDAFMSHGYTPQNALEVVLGIGAYTMSTLANRMTRAPLDEQLAAFAPQEHSALR